MILSLEILQAAHGDCLLLHYGDAADPRIIVIDGGPAGIYEKVLKPRLLEIKEGRSPNDPLPLSMVMVSHLDDDHVNGLCQLTDEATASIEDHSKPDFAVNHVWVNTFDDIIGNIQLPVVSALSASSGAADISSINIPGLENVHHSISAVLASTGQGRQIRDNISFLSATLNDPFSEIEPGKAALVRGDIGESVVNWDGPLKITVISPGENRLKKLQAKWDADLKKAKESGDNSIIFATITGKDTSPFNLSSIVCLVELGGKTILLTGDGRSDHILEDMKANGLLDDNDKLHVDILKMPHHLSIRNLIPEFLQQVTADHYVISADGSFDNPDQEALDLVIENITSGTLHFTNHDGKKNLRQKMDGFVDAVNSSGSGLQIKFREDDIPMVINLLDAVDF